MNDRRKILNYIKNREEIEKIKKLDLSSEENFFKILQEIDEAIEKEAQLPGGLTPPPPGMGGAPGGMPPGAPPGAPMGGGAPAGGPPPGGDTGGGGNFLDLLLGGLGGGGGGGESPSGEGAAPTDEETHSDKEKDEGKEEEDEDKKSHSDEMLGPDEEEKSLGMTDKNNVTEEFIDALVSKKEFWEKMEETLNKVMDAQQLNKVMLEMKMIIENLNKTLDRLFLIMH